MNHYIQWYMNKMKDVYWRETMVGGIGAYTETQHARIGDIYWGIRIAIGKTYRKRNKLP